MQVIIDGFDRESVEQLVSLMEHYLNEGFYMSPLRKGKDGMDQWFLIPLDVLEGTAYFN
jgi:hypothetical protein